MNSCAGRHNGFSEASGGVGLFCIFIFHINKLVQSPGMRMNKFAIAPSGVLAQQSFHVLYGVPFVDF
jgi:hypothetical protein